MEIKKLLEQEDIYIKLAIVSCTVICSYSWILSMAGLFQLISI